MINHLFSTETCKDSLEIYDHTRPLISSCLLQIFLLLVVILCRLLGQLPTTTTTSMVIIIWVFSRIIKYLRVLAQMRGSMYVLNKWYGWLQPNEDLILGAYQNEQFYFIFPLPQFPYKIWWDVSLKTQSKLQQIGLSIYASDMYYSCCQVMIFEMIYSSPGYKWPLDLADLIRLLPSLRSWSCLVPTHSSYPSGSY